MAYQNTNGVKNSDGSFTINADAYSRWFRQSNTDYGNLPESERASDREIADMYISLLGLTIEK
jgi:hypothetical protein